MGEQEEQFVSGVGSYSSYVTPIMRRGREEVKLLEPAD